MTIELYHNDMSTCAVKVRIALAEKSVSWTGHHMDLRAGDTHAPAYLKLNPNAVVPTLVHDGRVVIESTIICEYIDDAFPDPPLRPATAWGRARMRHWTRRLDDGLHPSIGVLSMCIAFRHQHADKTPAQLEAHLAGIPDAARRERQRLGLAMGMDSPSFEPALRNWLATLDAMQDVLAEDAWLAGPDFSLADLAYASYYQRLMHLGLSAHILARPAVAAWGARLLARPSVVEGMVRWNNAKYLALFDQVRPAAEARVRQLLAA